MLEGKNIHSIKKSNKNQMKLKDYKLNILKTIKMKGPYN